MDNNDRNAYFDGIIEERLEKTKATLLVKAKEYVRNNNRFHNFEVGAGITGISPERVLDGFMMKHYISYRDILNDIDKGQYPSMEMINEKFGDLINYLILQEGLIKSTIFNKSKSI